MNDALCLDYAHITLSSHTFIMTEPKVKKQRVERLQCEFFLEKKKRRCGMTRKAEFEYCSEHLNLLKRREGEQTHNGTGKGSRVPCPLDPRHTVWERELNRHLKKCNKAKQAITPTNSLCYRKDFNAVAQDCQPLPAVSDDLALRCIPILRDIFSKEFMHDDIPLLVKSNQQVEFHRFPQLLSNRKHAIQQSSLIQHLKENGLFPSSSETASTTYIEFGCGRAELSRYVNQSIILDQFTGKDKSTALNPPDFVLIDRASNRMKFDKKFVDDVNDFYSTYEPECSARKYPQLTREKIDIKDLYIDGLIESGVDGSKCVAISKHLCGVATDLTIRCVLNSAKLHVENQLLHGMLIAMCCRHACDPLQYANRPFIEKLLKAHTTAQDITYVQFFQVLKKVASWAVCGRKPGVNDQDVNNHFTKLPVVERESLGNMARRIIDEGRAQLLRDNGYRASLIRYVETDISLENVAMLVCKTDR